MAAQTTKTVYLITSAPTDWQGQHRMQGSTDLPHNEAAMDRMRPELEDLCARRSIGTVYTAPDEASEHTACVLAQLAGAAKVKKINDLEEMNLGLWEGLTEEELRERYPKAFGRWRSKPDDVTIPDGETLPEAGHRIGAALRRLLRRSGAETNAIVLRPIALAICTAHLTGENPGDLWPRHRASPPPAVQRFDLPIQQGALRRPALRSRRMSA